MNALHRIGEQGGQLSGGQRQRLALARAILRDPALLILDEATSQIDPESEQLIHKALEQFLRDRTAIMITHRFSTLDLADRILVMERGRIVEQGLRDVVLAPPHHRYTASLLASVPEMDPDWLDNLLDKRASVYLQQAPSPA